MGRVLLRSWVNIIVCCQDAYSIDGLTWFSTLFAVLNPEPPAHFSVLEGRAFLVEWPRVFWLGGFKGGSKRTTDISVCVCVVVFLKRDTRHIVPWPFRAVALLGFTQMVMHLARILNRCMILKGTTTTGHIRKIDHRPHIST